MQLRALGLLSALVFALGSAAVAAAPIDDGVTAARTGNYAEALRLLSPLAESGNAEAQFVLGVLYANGRGVARNAATAAAWYRRAAEQGKLEAQNNLAALYHEGAGVPDDQTEAFKWWSLAAERGFGRSQLNLATLYLDGVGVMMDYALAYKWAWLALAKGEGEAPKILERLSKVMTPDQKRDAEIELRDYQPPGAGGI